MNNQDNNYGGIKNLTIGGFKWFGLLQICTDLTAFIVNIILARLLLPSDFGLVALVTVITGLLVSIVELGFNAAVIQKKTISDDLLSTAFFINLFMSTMITALLIIISPLLGAFFNNESLIPMIRFFSIVLIVRALSSIQVAVYERSLNFKTIAYVTIIGVFFATVIKIYLAYRGFGAWSIVIGELISQMVIALLFWVKTPWLPAVNKVSHTSFITLFSFGSNIMLTRFLNSLSSKFDIMVVGRFLSAYDLGIYSMGFKFSNLLPNHINQVVAKVMFPSFSRMQDNEPLMIKAYLQVIKYICLISLPIVVGLILVAPEFISVVLTDKWLPAIPIIRILSLFSIANIMGGALWSQILKAKGLPRMALWMSVIRLIAMPLFIIAGLRWGLVGMAAGIAVYGWVFRFAYQYIVNRIINISMFDYLLCLVPAFVNVTIMAASVLAVKIAVLGLLNSDITILILMLLVGFWSYVISLFLLYKKEYYQLKTIVASFILPILSINKLDIKDSK